MTYIFNSGYERIDGDLYETPAWVVDVGMPFFGCRPPDTVWEPACGSGTMAGALMNNGFATVATDIETSYGETGDFLSDWARGAAEAISCDGLRRVHIVTNPPYSIMDKFIVRALQLTMPTRGTVAFLLPALALYAAKRTWAFDPDTAPFKAMVPLVKRIRWENLEQKENGPKQSHAWYIWDWASWRAPSILFPADRKQTEVPLWQEMAAKKS